MKRKYLRQIAKARLTAMGVGNVNRRMGVVTADGVKNWRKATTGETGKAAEKAQMNLGMLIKAKKHGTAVRNRRTIRKVVAE